MRITIGELKSIIKEAFTEHNIQKSKSMLISVLRITDKFAHMLTHGGKDRKVLLSSLNDVVREVEGWAPVFSRHYPYKQAVTDHLLDLLHKISQIANTPFVGFGNGKSRKADEFSGLVNELKAHLDEHFNVRLYDSDYQETDGETYSTGTRMRGSLDAPR